MSPKKSSKQLILDFLLVNVGRVVNSKQLQAASGWKAEWARRLRELRDEEGWLILSHKDRSDLKPGQYLLESTKRNQLFIDPCQKRHARMSWKETGTRAKCAGWRPAILIHSNQLGLSDLQWGTSSTSQKGAVTHRETFAPSAQIVMRDCRMPVLQSQV